MYIYIYIRFFFFLRAVQITRSFIRKKKEMSVSQWIVSGLEAQVPGFKNSMNLLSLAACKPISLTTQHGYFESA